MEQQGSVQSIERVFSIMEALARHPDGVQLTELAVQCALHKSTIHRLLSTLCALGYAGRTEDGRYRLTLKVLELSGRITDNIDVLGIAKPSLDGLRDRVQEAVHLVVRDGSDIVYVYKAESRSSAYRMFSRIGMRRALYCTAAGKSMLAALPDDEVERIWRRSDVQAFTEKTITTLEGLYEELEQVRRLGYALDNEENEPGVRCIAAAIRDYSGRPSAAFSVSAPIVRMTDDRIEALSGEILETRRVICEQLGYRGDA